MNDDEISRFLPRWVVALEQLLKQARKSGSPPKPSRRSQPSFQGNVQAKKPGVKTMRCRVEERVGRHDPQSAELKKSAVDLVKEADNNG